MIEYQEVLREFIVIVEFDPGQSGMDFLLHGRREPGAEENLAQRVDVAPDRVPVQKCGFQQRGSASEERIVDGVPGLGEAFDEESWKLRFETGAIGNLVQGMACPLFGGPKLVHIGLNSDRLGIGGRTAGFEDPGGGSEIGKTTQLLVDVCRW